MKDNHILVRSVVALAFVSAMPMLTARTAEKNPCDAALIQQVDYETLNESSSHAYLSQIDEETWNDKKKDAGFIGKWTGFLGPMSGDFSYKQFDTARKAFFKRIKYDESSDKAMTKLRRYVIPEQLEKWQKCNEDLGRNGRYGLFVTAVAVNDGEASFELRWIAPPPNGPRKVRITKSRVSGGRSLEEGAPQDKIYRDGEEIEQGSKTFTVARKLSEPLIVTVDAGGYSVTDKIKLPTPIPPPNSTPTTPSSKKESFQVLGVGHKDRTEGKYFGFDSQDLDAVVGRKDWDGALINVSRNPTGPFRQAIVWRSSNGTAGTAHGRYDKGWKPNDWKQGDLVYVQPVSK